MPYPNTRLNITRKEGMSYCSESSCWYWVSQAPASRSRVRASSSSASTPSRNRPPSLRCCGGSSTNDSANCLRRAWSCWISSARALATSPNPCWGNVSVEAACRVFPRAARSRGVAHPKPARAAIRGRSEMFPICWRRLARSNAGSSSAATRSWAALISDKFPYGRQQRSRKARRPMGLRGRSNVDKSEPSADPARLVRSISRADSATASNRSRPWEVMICGGCK